ncbi:hypothetical protein P7K49_031615 [Saguinus oedipus]|uniref:Uncharacterized protein n=1 Tax=Saguinus oedipus TaxID=9490 RepID=A0ABQ9TZX3_SAGOE|nr:hypothetical protein P7K49_031615 [Saguinus oedipus]
MFRAAGGEKTGFVAAQSFIAMWRKVDQPAASEISWKVKLLNNHHDDASKFICLLAKPNCSSLEQEDFIPLLQDVVDTHPGLTFLKDAPEFHSRYITTIPQLNGAISSEDHPPILRVQFVGQGYVSAESVMWKRTNVLKKCGFPFGTRRRTVIGLYITLALLEEEEDINQITDYFSYEHFYVIYCKFWELDTDHDLYISQADLSRYNDQDIADFIKQDYRKDLLWGSNKEDKRNPTSRSGALQISFSHHEIHNWILIKYYRQDKKGR